MSETSLARIGENGHAIQQAAILNAERIETLKRTYAKGLDDLELELLIEVCNRRRLDPFARQIYAIKRWDSQEKRKVMQLQVSIDGFRLIADRTGKYAGQLGPEWCGPDGKWRDIWLSDEPPAAARVGVLRKDFKEPLWRPATYKAFVQLTSDGDPNPMWRRLHWHMLAKCAEAIALRAAFPEDLSGLYSSEEMGMSSDEGRAATAPPPRRAPDEPDAEIVTDDPGPEEYRNDRGETPKEEMARLWREYGELCVKAFSRHGIHAKNALAEWLESNKLKPESKRSVMSDINEKLSEYCDKLPADETDDEGGEEEPETAKPFPAE